MGDTIDLMVLLQCRQILVQELNSIKYGSIEFRDNNKYIYVHYYDEGIPITKYAGKNTKKLYNEILANNFLAKQYKEEIRKINKKLKQLNYKNQELNDNIKDNVDFAKRNLVDSIYNQAILEGITTTFADTENIIIGGKVNNMSAEDVLKIINLKHSWQLILNPNVLLSESNYQLLCDINKIILEGFFYSAGRIRNIPVTITGTAYKPLIPIESSIKEELNIILNKKMNDVDKAIELLLYIMKKQVFIDGNKRTSILFINHFLISKGKGIIVIPSKETERFKKLLIKYYEGNDITTIKKFIKEKCYKSLN